MFLMLTPGLACAMPSCLPNAHETRAAIEPCEDGHMHGKQERGHGPMLNTECAKVDLQVSADHPTLKAPAFSGKIFHDMVFDDGRSHGFRLAHSQTIRGPPPNWLGTKQASASILITTARLRI
jgi:hypothetical protein